MEVLGNVWLSRAKVYQGIKIASCLLMVAYPLTIVFSYDTAHALDTNTSTDAEVRQGTSSTPASQQAQESIEVQPLPKPINGQPHQQIKSTSFNFTWDKVQDEPNEQISYVFQIASGLLSENELGADLQEVQSLDETVTFAETNKTEGVWYWRVKTLSNNRESAWSDIWRVTVDNTAPTVDISYPMGTYGGRKAGNIPFRATVTDTKGIKQCIVKQGDTELKKESLEASGTVTDPATHLSLTADIDAVNLSDGAHSITVIAEDIAGNIRTSTRTFDVDNTAPQLTTNISDDQVLQGIVAIDMAVNEQHPQASSITLLDSNNKEVPLRQIMADATDNTETLEVNSNSLKWDTRKVADGTYRLQFFGRDIVGNEAMITRLVVVDNTPAQSVGVVNTNSTPIVDPLLDQLSRQLTQPFPTPQAFAMAPATIPNVVEKDEDLLAAGTSITSRVDEGIKPIAVAPTESGWRILGVLWYWWFLIAGFLSVVTLKWRSLLQTATLVLRN
jgi:hypothetical protein